MKKSKKQKNHPPKKDPDDDNNKSIADRCADDLEITPEDKKKIKELSENPEIYKLIINSIIPSLHGYDDIKEAIALQLFGGVSREVDDGVIIPGGINILIVGDPGIGKTHLLKGALNLVLNGFYIDSNKSYVNSIYQYLNDDLDLQNIDESILNQENCLLCIDALKVKSDEVMFLKEVLGKNVSFNTKEELFNILNSKCSVIAATNPRFGRFDRYKSLIEQMNIPSTILSCFDLVFVLEDRNSMEEDAKMAHHLLKLHQENKINLEIDYNLLKRYIAYAREKVKPKLTDKAIEMIQEFYVRIRQLLVDEDLPIPITVRQLESLIKLSEASARIRLSAEVNESDVKRVIGFYERSLKQVGYDPQDVIINIDSHCTNLQRDTEDVEIVIEVLREIENRYDGQAPIELFIDIVSTRHDMGKSDVEETIKIIKCRGLAYEPQKGFLKLV